MEDRERVAHHEGAHAVAAHRIGPGLSEAGIDLDASTSVPEAYGNAAVLLWGPDETLRVEEQQWRFVRNLVIIFAGAASDARIKQISTIDALSLQPGDKGVAWNLIKESPLFDNPDPAKRQQEEESIFSHALERSRKLMDEPPFWEAVQRVAQAALVTGGRLSKTEIEVAIGDLARGP